MPPAVAIALAACTTLATGTASAQDGFVPVTDEMLANPDAADWLMWRRTTDSWGYSPLATVNRRNVVQAHAPVPNSIRVNNDVWSMLTLIQTPRLIGANSSPKTHFRQPLFETLLQRGFLLWIATSAWMLRRPIIATNKYVLVKLGHL
jgi:hypothetical protein